MPVRVFMLARNAVFLKPRWNMDQQVQKVLWSGRLPQVFRHAVWLFFRHTLT